jgi:IS30 family transposase
MESSLSTRVIFKFLGIKFYLARPYDSSERGSKKNNGLIRLNNPKKTDFDTISDDFIQFVVNELNNRSRKRFNSNSSLTHSILKFHFGLESSFLSLSQKQNIQ